MCCQRVANPQSQVANGWQTNPDYIPKPPPSTLPKRVLPPLQNPLSVSNWRAARSAHEARVDALLGSDLERRSHGRKNPVHDFLFEYYRFRPARLRRWSPGLGVDLEDAAELLDHPDFVPVENLGHTDAPTAVRLKPIPAKRRESAAWILNLLQSTAARRPMFGCHGLHEWAMVYEAADVRHPQLRLRLPHDEIRTVVETHPVRCTHFDAVRFFSRSALPFNQLDPQPESRPDFEQPGCLHANMDLYKWGFKLAPWVPSDLLLDTFVFAVAVREVDMRASPYDVSELGYAPIPIETPEGRAEYANHQRRFAEESQPLRKRLINVAKQIATQTSDRRLGCESNGL